MDNSIKTSHQRDYEPNNKSPKPHTPVDNYFLAVHGSNTLWDKNSPHGHVVVMHVQIVSGKTSKTISDKSHGLLLS